MNNRSLKEYFEEYAPLNYAVSHKGVDCFLCLILIISIVWFSYIFSHDLTGKLQYDEIIVKSLGIIIFSLLLLIIAYLRGYAEAEESIFLKKVKEETEINLAAKEFLEILETLKKNKTKRNFFKSRAWKILLEDEK